MNKTNWNANQKKMYLVDWLNIIPRELKERGEGLYSWCNWAIYIYKYNCWCLCLIIYNWCDTITSHHIKRFGWGFCNYGNLICFLCIFNMVQWWLLGSIGSMRYELKKKNIKKFGYVNMKATTTTTTIRVYFLV